MPELYKELRVGNWMHSNFTGEPFQVSILSISHEEERPGSIKPVPLTPEWLTRFGFKPFAKDFSKNGIVIHTRKRGFVLNAKAPVISSVHQLQNLYFCLRGEELTLKDA